MCDTYHGPQDRALSVAMAYATSDSPIHLWGEPDTPTLYRLGWARRCDDLRGDELVVVHVTSQDDGFLVCCACGEAPPEQEE